MNVTINSQTLATELRLLNKIVPNKPAIPILSHALFTADEHLTLYATDLEISLSTPCAAEVTTPGSVALPVGKLLAMVEQFMDADVTLAVDKDVTICCGAFKAKLQAMPVRDFPPPPEPEGEQSTFDGNVLRRLIAKTRYAVTSTGKGVLQGALLTVVGPAAAMVATDGKRLTLATMAAEGKDLRIVIPAKALDALVDQAGQTVELMVGSRHLFFTAEGRLLTSRMLDGKFPQYEKIIPRANDKQVVVQRLDLAAVLRRVLVAAEANQAIYLKITPGQMEITSASAEVGTADEAISTQYDGPPLTVCINGGYVLEFLEAAVGATITIALKDENSAVLLMDGNDYLDVIMLMRR